MKVVVIGLDGVSWSVINEFNLPNIRKVVENGVEANLESSMPFVTFPAWKCYSTGKNPGKLGVYWWCRISFRLKKILFHNSLSFKSEDFWDHLSREGKKVGIFYMPGTYPPKKLNGFEISGPLALEEKGFSEPRYLEDELKKRGYKHRLDIPPDRNPKKFYEWVKNMVNIKFDFTEDNLEDVDFFHLTIYYIDVFLHYFWLSEKTGELLKLIDKRIGRLLKKDVNIFLMSDHGMGELKGIFYINDWLKKRRLLVGRNVFDVLFKLGLNRNNLLRFFRAIGMLSFLKKIIPKETRRAIPTRDGIVRVRGLERKVDWKKTNIIATAEGPVYITPFLGEKEKNILVKNLKTELLRLEHPNTGDKVIKKAYEASEVYSGPYVDEAPDLVLYQNDGYEISGALHENPIVFAEDMKEVPWIANHRLMGIFAAFGPDIRKGERLKKVRIYDIAPTILHMFGLPVPKDIDGRVLKEIFKKSSEVAKRRVKYSEPEEVRTEKYRLSEKEEMVIKERLKALGYLD